MWRCKRLQIAVQCTSHYFPSQRVLFVHPQCYVLTWFARKRPRAAIKPVHVAARKTTNLNHKSKGFHLGQQKAPPRAGQDSKPLANSEVGSEQQTGAAGAGAAGSKFRPTKNVLLPEEVDGLNDFAVPTTNRTAEVASGAPTVVTYVVWITTLLLGIGAFYGAVFAASGGLSSFLKDKITFTRKENFVPYSQRRLEAELLAKERLKDSSAIGTPLTNSETVSDGETRQRMTSQGLYNLMPAPPTK